EAPDAGGGDRESNARGGQFPDGRAHGRNGPLGQFDNGWFDTWNDRVSRRERRGGLGGGTDKAAGGHPQHDPRDSNTLAGEPLREQILRAGEPTRHRADRPAGSPRRFRVGQPLEEAEQDRNAVAL